MTVPVNPDFPSLNLAQCVLLLGYEWRRQAGGGGPLGHGTGPDRVRSREEVDRLADHFESGWMRRGLLSETKVEGMKANLRNMWGRLGLTRAEVQTFHGMLRQIAYKLKKQGD